MSAKKPTSSDVPPAMQKTDDGSSGNDATKSWT